MEITKKDILLVDDNPADNRLLKEALKMSGFKGKVHTAYNGRKALEKLHQWAERGTLGPDTIVFVDYYLPGQTGTQLIDEIRADRSIRDVSIILTSGLREIRNQSSRQANFFLSKTDSFFDLLESVQVLLKSFLVTVL